MPKISNLEIYLRNALDYCLTQNEGSEWAFDENSLIPLIEEVKCPTAKDDWAS